MATADSHYYIPHGTRWPIMGSIGLTLLVGGFAAMLNGSGAGGAIMTLGVLVMIVMMFGWFGQVVHESETGTYSQQVDVSFRWGMGWFIFSEVCFFAAFFGALFYARIYAVPWLGGTLCVQPPLRRTQALGSGGNAAPANDCSGVYAFDMNAWVQAGGDPLLVPGTTIYARKRKSV